MHMIRGLLFYLAMALSVIVLMVLLLATKPFVSLDVRYERICRPWAKFILRLLRVICGIRIEEEGMENMPRDGAYVVLAKHQSALDPFWLGARLARPACFLYKKSLHMIPCLGWAIWSMDMLAVDRSQGRSAFENFMRKGPDVLKRGWWICLFPEGTRVPPGERVPYKTGGARFACATNTPIIPIAHNAGHCWPKNCIAKYPGVVRISVGPVIPTEGRDPHEISREVEAWIEAETARLDR